MARATGSPRAGAAPRSPLRRSRAAALLALCASLPACAASPAPPTVTVAARGDAVLTRGAIDAAVASGTAARACSGAWALSPARELHLELPRPRAHAARAGEAPHAGPHVLSIQGVPQDATRFADDFEVVYTDPSGGALGRTFSRARKKKARRKRKLLFARPRFHRGRAPRPALARRPPPGAPFRGHSRREGSLTRGFEAGARRTWRRVEVACQLAEREQANGSGRERVFCARSHGVAALRRAPCAPNWTG